MDKLGDEEITELAKSVARNEVPEIIYLLRNRYDLDSFLEVVISWVWASGFPFNDTSDDEKYSFVIQHDLSRKWSLYLAELFESIFEQVANRKAVFGITANTLVFTVNKDGNGNR
jgi:hypothetical protein